MTKHLPGLFSLLQQALAPMFTLHAEAIHRFAQRRQRASRRRELQGLSDAILRDLGINRAEIDSLLAEADGRAAATRVRVLPAARNVAHF